MIELYSVFSILSILKILIFVFIRFSEFFIFTISYFSYIIMGIENGEVSVMEKAKILEALIKERGYNLKSFAAKCGIPYTTLYVSGT